jgi:hypothetical protein
VLISSWSLTNRPSADEAGEQVEEFSQAPAPVPEEILDRITAASPGASVIEVPSVQRGARSLSNEASSPPHAVPMDAALATFGPSRDETFEVHAIGIATPALLDLFDVPQSLRDAVEDGAAIAVIEAPAGAQRVVVGDGIDAATGLPGVEPGVPLFGSFASPSASSGLPQILVSPATAREMGLTVSRGGLVVLDHPRSIDGPTRRALSVLAQDISWEAMIAQSRQQPQQHYVDVSVPPDPDRSEQIARAVLLGVSLLLVAAVVAVGLALAARDSEDERQVLAALGAPPRTTRRVGTLRAALLVLTAALIAVPAGLLPAAAIVAAEAGNHQFRVDLVVVGFLLLVMPAVVALAAAVCGRLRDVLRPSRPDVFAFSD